MPRTGRKLQICQISFISSGPTCPKSCASGQQENVVGAQRARAGAPVHMMHHCETDETGSVVIGPTYYRGVSLHTRRVGAQIALKTSCWQTGRGVAVQCLYACRRRGRAASGASAGSGAGGDADAGRGSYRSMPRFQDALLVMATARTSSSSHPRRRRCRRVSGPPSSLRPASFSLSSGELPAGSQSYHPHDPVSTNYVRVGPIARSYFDL